MLKLNFPHVSAYDDVSSLYYIIYVTSVFVKSFQWQHKSKLQPDASSVQYGC